MTAFRPSTKACHAASRLGRTIDRALAESKVNPAGYRLLAHLTTGGGSAATELAEKLLVSRPTVTATIDWLEERAMVVRSPDPADGRKVSVAPTAKGRAALKSADDLVANRLTEVLASLGDDGGRAVSEALEQLHDALDDDRRRRHSDVLQR